MPLPRYAPCQIHLRPAIYFRQQSAGKGMSLVNQNVALKLAEFETLRAYLCMHTALQEALQDDSLICALGIQSITRALYR